MVENPFRRPGSGHGRRRDQWTVWLDRHVAAPVLFARQWVFQPRRCRGRGPGGVHPLLAITTPCCSDPAAYFYACVKHVVAGLAAQSGRRRGVPAREEAAARPEPTTLLRRSTRAERTPAMPSRPPSRSLPENQREVLVMKIWGDLSFLRSPRPCKIPANTEPSPGIATRRPSWASSWRRNLSGHEMRLTTGSKQLLAALRPLDGRRRD